MRLSLFSSWLLLSMISAVGLAERAVSPLTQEALREAIAQAGKLAKTDDLTAPKFQEKFVQVAVKKWGETRGTLFVIAFYQDYNLTDNDSVRDDRDMVAFEFAQLNRRLVGAGLALRGTLLDAMSGNLIVQMRHAVYLQNEENSLRFVRDRAARALGYVDSALDLRLEREARTRLEGRKTALRWIQDNAAQYRADLLALKTFRESRARRRR